MPYTYYKKTRWEGQSWSYKVKFAYAKYPFLVISSLISVLLIPVSAAIRLPGYENSRHKALSKYRPEYIVLRDDDPRLDAVIKQKERGREHFPKY